MTTTTFADNVLAGGVKGHFYVSRRYNETIYTPTSIVGRSVSIEEYEIETGKRTTFRSRNLSDCLMDFTVGEDVLESVKKLNPAIKT